MERIRRKEEQEGEKASGEAVEESRCQGNAHPTFVSYQDQGDAPFPPRKKNLVLKTQTCLLLSSAMQRES